jgi:PAS domain S-box-containing protein
MIPVLYVDDEVDLLEIGRIFLERTGDFTVDVAESAHEGLHRLEMGTYAAVLSDYQMPGMDGITFLREVRSRDPIIPFLLFTGRGREEVVIQALEHGADFYIQKGGDPTAQFAELRHKILQAVGRREAERELRESQKQYAMTLDALNEAPWDWDFSTGQISFSERGFEMLGYQPGEIPYTFEGWMRLVHPDDVEKVLQEQAVVGRRDGDDGFSSEFRMKSRQGEWRWILSRGRVVERVEDGRATRMVGTHQDVTELRAAERQREQTLSILTSTLESTADGIIVLDVAGAVLAYNQKFLDLWGLDTDAVQYGERFETESVLAEHLEDRAGFMGLAEAKSDDAGLERLDIVRLRDGRIFQWYSHPPRMADRIRERVWSFRDVTSEHRALEHLERANLDLARNLAALAESKRHLAESEDRYRRIVETAYEGVWTLDADFVTISTNSRMAELLGYSPQEMIGRSVLEFIAEEDRAEHEVRIAERRSGSAGSYERRLVRRDGSEIWMHVSATPIIGDDDRFAGSFAMFTDITERKQVELDLLRANEELGGAYEEMSAINEELEESMDELRLREQRLFKSEQFLEGLVEHANVPIVVWAPDGRILRFNRAFERLTGRPASSVVNSSVETLFPNDHRALVVRELARANAGEAWEDIILPVLRFSGDARELTWNSAPLYSHDGSTLEAVVAQGRDLTAERQAASALIVANRKLHLLSSLTRHDVQNRLLAAEGFLEIARSTNTDERIVRPLARVADAVADIRRQIAFTRDYQDLGVSAPTWHSLGTILERERSREEFRSVDISDGWNDLEVLADPLIERVIHNLIDNAVRHGEHVTQIATSAEPDGETLVLVVEDNGVGVEPGEKERIFEREVGKNTGLGLFLSREVLAITGIEIHETGTRGRGARFELHVPAGRFRLRKSS